MEFLLRLLTPCDFPQQRSQGVSMSQHLKMCAHMCWTLDAAHPSGVIQPEVESYLLIEESISHVSAETYENLISCDQNSPPLALI